MIEDIEQLKKHSLHLLNKKFVRSNKKARGVLFHNIERTIALAGLILNSKETIAEHLPDPFMRQWFIACAKNAKSRLVRLKTELANTDTLSTRQEQQMNIAALWSLQAISLFETRMAFERNASRTDGLLIDSSSLREGDLVLSFKTHDYLKKNILSKLISLTTRSPFTHSLIVTESGAGMKLLCASPEQNGLGLRATTPKAGEAFIVLRPKEDLVDLRRLEIVTQKWLERCRENRDEYRFAELKSWVATLIGLVYVCSVSLLGRSITLPNPASKRGGIFCSELINLIYKEVGILLTPRSLSDAVVGPVEFFHSPYFEWRGIIVNGEDGDRSTEELGRYLGFQKTPHTRFQ